MAQIAEQLQEYAAPASEAININLTRNGEKIFDTDFQPVFTYAMFGEEETILGYQDLNIDIDFRAHDMKPSVNINYGKKMKPINEEMERLMDIESQLADFLPEDAFAGPTEEGDLETWSPPGTLNHSYESAGRKFEIWVAPLSDPKAMEILKNMRILIPFLIEGGTVGMVDETGWSLERWKIFLLYEVTEGYTLAGFGTSYRLWVFPSRDVARMATISNTLDQSSPLDTDATELPEQISPLDLSSRERISQFLVLPPYQGQSHGTLLYSAMTSLFRADSHVFEITVEEPNEDFDVLRDQCDLAYLMSQKPAFRSLSLPSSIPADKFKRTAYIPDFIDPDLLFKIRAESKIAPRQFQRLTEIHLLSTLPSSHRNASSVARLTQKARAADENDRKLYFWRHMVKERVFVKNRDALMQVEEEERASKVEETLPGVLEEYEKLIATFQRRQDQGLMRVIEAFEGSAKNGANGATKAGAASGAGRKRKVIDDDDDDDEDGEDGVAAGANGTADSSDADEAGVGGGRPPARKKVAVETNGKQVAMAAASSPEVEQNTLHE